MTIKDRISNSSITIKAFYIIAIAQYVLALLSALSKNTGFSNSIMGIVIVLFSLNLYLAIINIIFIRKVPLIILQLLLLSVFVFFNTAMDHSDSSILTFAVEFIKGILKFLIPIPIRRFFNYY